MYKLQIKWGFNKRGKKLLNLYVQIGNKMGFQEKKNYKLHDVTS
jgi:hypothetical protein